MELLLSKDDLNKLKRLLEIKELNIASSNAYFEFSFSKYKPEEILTFLDLDLSSEEDLFFFEKYFKDNFTLLNRDKYINNPYAKIFKNIDIKDNNYRLTHLRVKPYQSLPYDDIEIYKDEYYLEKSKIGYFDKTFSYFAITKDNVVWMSTDPNEIETMEPYINKVNGSLLVFGLGLGYFPYMSDIKGNVKEITIIEKDKKVIALFKKYIEPKLDNKHKFNIIEDDAFNFIKNNDIAKYDSIFVDIWHSPEDGLPLFIKFKSLLNKYDNHTYYWLNKSLLAMFRRCLLTIFEEKLNNYSDKDYLKSENEYDKIINKLYFLMKKESFTSFDQIIDYLDDRHLNTMIIQLL